MPKRTRPACWTINASRGCTRQARQRIHIILAESSEVVYSKSGRVVRYRQQRLPEGDRCSYKEGLYSAMRREDATLPRRSRRAYTLTIIRWMMDGTLWPATPFLRCRRTAVTSTGTQDVQLLSDEVG